MVDISKCSYSFIDFGDFENLKKKTQKSQDLKMIFLSNKRSRR